jgi:pimeloyl-ACP methyl ester carboxylesterase
MPRLKTTIVLACLAAAVQPLNAQDGCDSSIPLGDNTGVGRFVSVDRSRVYYETYGDPAHPPLVLIHGNGGSISSMRCQILHFMQDYHVVVGDNRTHGKSGGSDHLTYGQISDDYAAILDELALDSVYVLGQSDGGIVGLLLAIHHPDKVGKLVAAVPNLRPGKSAVEEWELELSKDYRTTIDSMIAAGDTSRDWHNMKVHMELMVNEPHIELTDLETISCPVLVMTSDDDIIKPRHILAIYEHIPNAHLFVMPGATHFMLRDEYELFNYMAGRFFSEPFERPTSQEVLLEIIGRE